ncbi:MAG: DUF192 domain-containing protein [Acidobacteriota bacterium]
MRTGGATPALLLALASWVAGTAGCQRPGGPAASAGSASPSPVSVAAGPRVQFPSGSVYRLELAKTPEDQAQGLMYRESLPEKRGMLFLFPDAGVHKFWMKNTMIPLDMIWLDANGKVLFVNAGTPPCKADPCDNYGPDAPASSVLEIAGGLAAREKVTVGSMLRFLDVR